MDLQEVGWKSMD